MTDPRPPALLLTTWNDSEAELIRQLLASHGIECSVSSEVPHSVLPLTVDGLGEIRVHVPAEALEEAGRILEAYRAGAPRAPEKRPPRGEVLSMPLKVTGATRIDLAGGTLDIWPIYLLLDRPVTVNVAIDLHALVEVSFLPGRQVILRSEDQQTEAEADSPDELDPNGPLPLPARLVRSFAPAGGVRLTSAATAPAGSGLGGSSALAVAAAVALGRMTRTETGADVHALARRLANLEAQVLGIPTGVQDYYPALLGGLLVLAFSAEGVTAERLEMDTLALEERLVLVYEGGTRSSGISNLDMLRRFLDGDAATRSAMAEVAGAARELADALRGGDLDAAGAAMAREMDARRRLSPTVMTPVTEQLFAAAREAGALGAKVCGAGGGGCSVFWAAAGGRPRLEQALEAAGGRILPFKVEHQRLLAATT
jgi:D-glycero-alpha-D-manno-heptose-7-phosphate kinase